MKRVALLTELLARCRFPARGANVTCAVSGGPDSLALLALAVEAGCWVTAVHVDHQLRAGSAGEAELVRNASVACGAKFRSVRVDIDEGPNLEARARAARYAVLPPDVLVGHTADDQAETVLINLLRGAGVGGLMGIRRDGRRPLIDLRRHETHALCAALGWPAVDDEMNRDPRYQRVRVRHEVLPLLADIAGRDVVDVLTRQSALAADVVAVLDQLAANLDATDAKALRAAPVALARWALREWLRRETADEHPPSAAALDRVMAVVRGEVTATEIEGGWRVARSQQRLSLRRNLGL